MRTVTPDAPIGVIVGRFQTPSLHDGHKELIDEVRSRHPKVLILVGCKRGVMCTRKNPLDYYTRLLMIREEFPNVVVLPIYDMPSDHDWSKAVDEKIGDAFGGLGDAVLYGSRDSFIPHYHGRWSTVELEDSKAISGTQARKLASDDVRVHEEFRRGVVYGAFNRHPVAYPTVDMVLYDSDHDAVLLGRKVSDEPGKWRFPGGFVDPSDPSLEAAAKRELSEEVGQVETHEPVYLGSLQIDDWRYRGEVDTIMTSVFFFTYMFGPIDAGDDLHEVRWVPLAELNPSDLVSFHQPILEMFKAHLEKE